MVSKDDFNLLEAYLDDALSATEVEHLDRRFSTDSALFNALQSLRQERLLRVASIHSHLPTERMANRFADQLLSSLRTRETHGKWGQGIRMVTALAACLLVGFSVGWMGRGSDVALDRHVTVPAGSRADSHLVLHSNKPAEPGQFQVAILDENGNVIAVQRFNKMEEARQFANDLAQYEARRQQVQEGQAMLISDRF